MYLDSSTWAKSLKKFNPQIQDFERALNFILFINYFHLCFFCALLQLAINVSVCFKLDL